MQIRELFSYIFTVCSTNIVASYVQYKKAENFFLFQNSETNLFFFLQDASLICVKANTIEYQGGSPFYRSSESVSSVRTKTMEYKKEDDLNCIAIKETLMANRLPESCV